MQQVLACVEHVAGTHLRALIDLILPPTGLDSWTYSDGTWWVVMCATATGVLAAAAAASASTG